MSSQTKERIKNNYRIVVIVIVVSFYLFDLILEQIEILILEDL